MITTAKIAIGTGRRKIAKMIKKGRVIIKKSANAMSRIALQLMIISATQHKFRPIYI